MADTDEPANLHETVTRLERENIILRIQLLTVTKDMSQLVALLHVLLHTGGKLHE